MTPSDLEVAGKSRYSFPKNEKLCSKKIIDEIFKSGSSVYSYPFKLYYKDTFFLEPPQFPQVLFSIPKKNFKRAVDRNRLKRLLREAYRLNKSTIFLSHPIPYPSSFVVVYIAKEIISFEILKEKLILVLLRLKSIQKKI